MARILSLCLTIVLISQPISRENSDSFIVWNVGQGAWSTYVTNESCDHFDLGGEFFPILKIRNVCGNKLNRIYLTHWDQDHVGFIKAARGFLNPICLAARPLGHSSSRKQALIKDVRSCPGIAKNWAPPIQTGKSTNELSQFFSMGDALITGDGPKSEETLFLSKKPFTIDSIRILLLGHHGSRTSTSTSLLQALPHLQMAVVSARKLRYGHPHIETIMRVKSRHLPMINTEDWGNIQFSVYPRPTF